MCKLEDFGRVRGEFSVAKVFASRNPSPSQIPVHKDCIERNRVCVGGGGA